MAQQKVKPLPLAWVWLFLVLYSAFASSMLLLFFKPLYVILIFVLSLFVAAWLFMRWVQKYHNLSQVAAEATGKAD
jgi:membrane protein implicated in regulation of membrane protease activity